MSVKIMILLCWVKIVHETSEAEVCTWKGCRMMLLISRTSQGFSLREALSLLLLFIIIIKCVIFLNVVWSRVGCVFMFFSGDVWRGGIECYRWLILVQYYVSCGVYRQQIEMVVLESRIRVCLRVYVNFLLFRDWFQDILVVVQVLFRERL